MSETEFVKGDVLMCVRDRAEGLKICDRYIAQGGTNPEGLVPVDVGDGLLHAPADLFVKVDHWEDPE